MHRWNDQIRTVDFTELDKQAHKMIIAYVLGKCEEKHSDEVNWIEIIESGIFEFLQRIVLTDLKPPLFHRIKQDRQKYKRLNNWVYNRIESVIFPLGEDFCRRFKQYLFETEKTVNRRIISAAHFYATKWEFNILLQANPRGYLMREIEKDISEKQDRYFDLQSMQMLLNSDFLRGFVDICGRLRFQMRWSHVHRVPSTSVLGHMLIVAMISYLCSLEVKAEPVRSVNNYLTGLFHDLPEVLTRDVISPVKRSVEGLDDLIKEYENEEMEKKVYKLLPDEWSGEMKNIIEDEFSDIKDKSGRTLRDGKMLKAIDDLSAFIEVYLSTKNGIQNEILDSAAYSMRNKYKSSVISGINFTRIYEEFNGA